MLFSQDRHQLRAVFFSAWKKYRAGEPLAGAEQSIVHVVLHHPEYHALLDQPESAGERDFFPELGETNPFLHLALHISIDEQLAINQPAGIRACYAQLRQRFPDEHAAQHQVMECLGETLWQADRARGLSDSQHYLDCLTRHAGSAESSRS